MNNFIQQLHLAIFTLLLSVTIHAQIDLHGNLLYDTKAPVPNTLVMADTARGTTDSRGQFVLRLPADVKAGQGVMVRVSKDGYLIDKPLDGLWNASNRELQGIQPFTVIIVRKGSLTLLSDARLNQMMDQFKDNFTRQISSLRQQNITSRKELAASKQEIVALKAQVLPSLLGQWQQEYGLSSEQIKVVLDKYANTKNPTDDFRAQALKEYYNGNFSAASNFFEKAALAKEDDIIHKEAELELDKLSASSNWKAKGKSDFSNYDFSASIKSYDRATKLLAREKHPQEWAELEVLFGNAKQELGTRTDPAITTKLLTESVQHYRTALMVYTQKDLPQDWAMTQNSLGGALMGQGKRGSGGEAVRLLGESVAAHRAALEVYTQKDLPQDWAATQNNLGNALSSQGEYSSGNEAKRLLEESVVAYRAALVVRTQKDLPRDWAATQNNLGIALSLQGELSSGNEAKRLLGEAVAAYRAALVVTQKDLSQDWAATQNNLGAALMLQGERSSGNEAVRLLGEAVTAYRAALEVYTQKDLPQDWAATQNNLGLALSSQGEYSSGNEAKRILEEAVAAYRAALVVRTQKALPQDWAATQNNLAVVLSLQGERSSGNEAVRLLGEAVAAYRAVLVVFTQKDLPQRWAQTQNNLGNALKRQGVIIGGQQGVRLAREAIAVLTLALAVRHKEYDAQGWVQTQNNLAGAYFFLEDWANAAVCYTNVFHEYQGIEEVNARLSGILHERIFMFAEAFALNGHRVKLDAEDLSAQSDFAETHFTTARFAEAETRINALLANPKVEADIKTALRAIQIANGLAVGKSATVNLNSLIALIAAQPPDFQVGWSFRGTLHFIETNDKFTANRAWLQQLFAAFEQENRDAILKALRALPPVK